MTPPEEDSNSAPDGWICKRGHPWRRLGARLFDQILLGTIFWFIISALIYGLAPNAWLEFEAYTYEPWFRLLEPMLNLAALVPINALLLGMAKTTPGKLLFGVRVVRPDGQRIGFPAALWREAQVWVVGYGLGIPLISLLAMWDTKTKIEARGASWDVNRGHRVYYRPEGGRQNALAVIGVLLIVLGIIGTRALEVWANQIQA